jgi:hypothetical protein
METTLFICNSDPQGVYVILRAASLLTFSYLNFIAREPQLYRYENISLYKKYTDKILLEIIKLRTTNLAQNEMMYRICIVNVPAYMSVFHSAQRNGHNAI